MANSGVLLIASTLEGLGMPVDTLQVAKVAFPVAVISFVLWFIQNMLFDKKLKQKYAAKEIEKVRGDQ